MEYEVVQPLWKPFFAISWVGKNNLTLEGGSTYLMKIIVLYNKEVEVANLVFQRIQEEFN